MANRPKPPIGFPSSRASLHVHNTVDFTRGGKWVQPPSPVIDTPVKLRQKTHHRQKKTKQLELPVWEVVAEA